MATIRELASEAWEREKAENDDMRLAKGRELREDLIELGLDGDHLVVSLGGVEADREGLSFRSHVFGIEVRDHDWPEGVWKTFHDLAGLGAALATSDEEEAEDARVVPEDRVANALERIAAALEGNRGY